MKPLRLKTPKQKTSARNLQKDENLKVVSRIRPITKTEQQNHVVRCVAVKDGSITINDKRNKIHKFEFSNVFGPQTSQQDLFNATVEPMIDEVLEGFSCAFFCYGQTGTGKTYTMHDLLKKVFYFHIQVVLPIKYLELFFPSRQVVYGRHQRL